MIDEKPRKAYEAPKVTAHYSLEELLASLGPAHAIYGDSGVAP